STCESGRQPVPLRDLLLAPGRSSDPGVDGRCSAVRPRQRTEPHHALIGGASSLIVVVAPFALTDSIPASRVAADAYIWLVPMTWPFAAFRLKYSLPFDAVLRSERASSPQFFCTEAMPFSADAFALYVSLRRIVSPLPALRTKEYCPLSFWLSTYHPAMNASLLREVPPPDSAA